MNKNTTPIIIAAAIVVLGGIALWYGTQNQSPIGPVPLVTPAPVLATSTKPATAADGLPAAPAGLPPGTKVTGRTVWEGKTADDWKIAFNIETTWKIQTLSLQGSTAIAQMTGGDDTTTFFVSRNIRIAEPSNLSFSTKKLTIAGVNVTAHIYTNPKPTSAFYEYFALPVGGDSYYFRLESKSASTKVAEDFESLIVIK